MSVADAGLPLAEPATAGRVGFYRARRQSTISQAARLVAHARREGGSSLAETTRVEAHPLLSVVIPVLDEERTLQKVLEAVARSPVEKEIIVVDDGSTDSSRRIAEEFACAHAGVRVLGHERRQGKGRALRTGFAACRGTYVIVQDADLEYDPADYARLLAVVQSGAAEVAYGSRRGRWRNMGPLQRLGNWAVTWTCNVLYGARLTDLETCYKLLPRSLLEQIPLDAHGFEFEAEVTARILRRGWRIGEAPIAYAPRAVEQGKKIGWRDGVHALWTLVKYRWR